MTRYILYSNSLGKGEKYCHLTNKGFTKSVPHAFFMREVRTIRRDRVRSLQPQATSETPCTALQSLMLDPTLAHRVKGKDELSFPCCFQLSTLEDSRCRQLSLTSCFRFVNGSWSAAICCPPEVYWVYSKWLRLCCFC